MRAVARCAPLWITALIAVPPLFAQGEVDARPNLRRNPNDTIERARYSDRIDILSVGFDYVSPSGGSFFDEYAKLGAQEPSLGSYLSPFIAGRIALTEQVRFLAHTGYHAAKLSETYVVGRSENPRVPSTATVREDLSVLAFPVLAGLEFAPLRTQFTSYVGVAAGLAFTKARWETTVLASEGGFVRPTRNSNNFGVAPAARLYAGVDLRFDRPSESRATFRGIFLEACYSFMPVRREYFVEVRSRGEGIVDGPAQDDATLYLGGLTFTFGLNLQVLRP